MTALRKPPVSSFRSSPFALQGLTAQLLAQGIQPRTATMRRIKDLLDPLAIIEAGGSLDLPVRSLCTDSRRATPGSLFFALAGRRTHGQDHVEEAVHRGAVGVVSEEDIWVPRGTTTIRVRAAHDVLAGAARRFHGNPEEALELIGVTGTSGKTVVATLLRSILGLEKPVGLLGTIHYHLGPRTLPSYRTTPEPVDLYSMLGQIRDYGCERTILEVSSHGIDQGRVKGLHFSLAAFLNLSEQHLEYHGSMEAYFDTVQRLFDGRNGPAPATVVLNDDDPWAARLREALPGSTRVIGFGLSGATDVRAENLLCSAEGTRFELLAEGCRRSVTTPLIGGFNVSNALAAMTLAHAAGLDWDLIVERVAGAPAVRGRMETIQEGQDFTVVVDYMHTPEAYRAGLKTLRDLAGGKLITVFGCGGDRDRSARPLITEEVMRSSDIAIATADNPRSESLEAIFEDMRQGIRAGDPVHFIENRRHAISVALDAAGPGDLVLIAGKGHETYQEYTDTVMPFDDRAVVRELLRKKQQYDRGEC